MSTLNNQNFKAVQIIIIDADTAGQRLDNYLIKTLKNLPRSRIYAMVRSGELRINKGRIKPLYKLQEGDSVRIPPLHLQPKISPDAEKLERFNVSQHIIFEDDNLMIVNKPSGLAAHGGSGLNFGLIEAMRLARPELKNLELVHRLDRETSGCILLAKKRAELRHLHQCFQDARIKKNYLLLIKGRRQGPLSIDAPLQKNILVSGERLVKVNSAGQIAKTHFTVLNKYPKATLMQAYPVTGRTHQIRVHALHAGHPILGDEKYGHKSDNLEFKTLGLGRLFLHASELTIPRLNSIEPLKIQAALDPKLVKLLSRLQVGEPINE